MQWYVSMLLALPRETLEVVVININKNNKITINNSKDIFLYYSIIVIEINCNAFMIFSASSWHHQKSWINFSYLSCLLWPIASTQQIERF